MKVNSRENAEKVLKEMEQKIHGKDWNEKAYYSFIETHCRDEIVQRIRQLELQAVLRGI